MTSHEKALYLPHSGSDCTIYCICLYVQVCSYTLNTSTPTCATICIFSSTSYTNSRIYHSLGILHSYICKYSEQLCQPQKFCCDIILCSNITTNHVDQMATMSKPLGWLVVATVTLNLTCFLGHFMYRHSWGRSKGYNVLYGFVKQILATFMRMLKHLLNLIVATW